MSPLQASDYGKVMSAFRVLGFSTSAVDSIWALVASILHIGNMEFAPDAKDNPGFRDAGLVGKVATLLDVATNDLSQALLTRVIAASGEVDTTPRLVYLFSLCG